MTAVEPSAETLATSREAAESEYPDLNAVVSQSWSGTSTMPVIDPSTERTLGHLPLASSSDIEAALGAAAAASQAWASTAAADRAAILHRASELLRSNSERIASLITLEEGKRLLEARMDVTRAADNLSWFAGEATRIDGRIIPPRRPGSEAAVIYEPIGPVAAFTPWNGPVSAPARKVATALAAGCSCVIKPAEEAPAAALAVAQALRDAGLPDDTMSMVFGDPASVASQFVQSPVIRAVSFTGSTRIGQEIARLAADGVKRLTLELGGHAPVLVFEDADVEAAVSTSIVSKFERNAGQVCISPSRFFVTESRYNEFLTRFAQATTRLRIGDGFDPGVNMGPLATARRVTAMKALVDDATEKGAKVVVGGRAPDRDGFFFEPTVLADVPADARVMTEEPFGPIAVIARVSGADEAIERANALPFGLAAYGFTSSLETSQRFANEIEAGIVGLTATTSPMLRPRLAA